MNFARPNFANPTGDHADAIAAWHKAFGHYPAGTTTEDIDGTEQVVAFGTVNGEDLIVTVDGAIHLAEDYSL